MRAISSTALSGSMATVAKKRFGSGLGGGVFGSGSGRDGPVLPGCGVVVSPPDLSGAGSDRPEGVAYSVRDAFWDWLGWLREAGLWSGQYFSTYRRHLRTRLLGISMCRSPATSRTARCRCRSTRCPRCPWCRRRRLGFRALPS